MAKGSHPPTFAAYGVKRRCYGCGRKLTADEPGGLMFVGTPRRGVFGRECFWIAARYGRETR